MSVGDILGESGALSGLPRGAQLVCRNKVMLYEMSREDFLRMLTTEQLGKIRQVVRMRDSVTARLIESVRAARTHVRRSRLSFLATGMCVLLCWGIWRALVFSSVRPVAVFLPGRLL
jgi:CRP-like cAMP-binding protein